MITTPLTYKEEKLLRQTIKDIKNLSSLVYDSNPDFRNSVISITIDKDNYEMWLNILSMAERANEIVTSQWRRGGDSVVNF